jgi:acetyl esterase/lipase
MLTIDPALFRPEAVSDETARFNAEIEATLAEMPAVHELPVEQTRKLRDEGFGIFPLGGPLEGSDWREIPGAGVGPGRVRVSPAPGRPKGLYLHIHGGGWTIGRPWHFDRANQALAEAAGVTVVSVEYRLAPENPFPAGPDDCLAAARWLIENAEKEFGTDRIVIGGESAGAHLSAATLLRLRDEAGLGGRIAGAVLNYGAYDLRLTPSMRRWGARKLILSTPTVEWFTANFVPDPAAREDPVASPALADLSDMPPALFQVGTEDPLIDDTLLMAARWAGAGAKAELRVFPGGIHAFDAFDLDIARAARARQAEFVAETVA